MCHRSPCWENGSQSEPVGPPSSRTYKRQPKLAARPLMNRSIRPFVGPSTRVSNRQVCAASDRARIFESIASAFHVCVTRNLVRLRGAHSEQNTVSVPSQRVRLRCVHLCAHGIDSSSMTMCARPRCQPFGAQAVGLSSGSPFWRQPSLAAALSSGSPL